MVAFGLKNNLMFFRLQLLQSIVDILLLILPLYTHFFIFEIIPAEFSFGRLVPVGLPPISVSQVKRC
jgi:hypothetical protein